MNIKTRAIIARVFIFTLSTEKANCLAFVRDRMDFWLTTAGAVVKSPVFILKSDVEEK